MKKKAPRQDSPATDSGKPPPVPPPRMTSTPRPTADHPSGTTQGSESKKQRQHRDPLLRLAMLVTAQEIRASLAKREDAE